MITKLSGYNLSSFKRVWILVVILTIVTISIAGIFIVSRDIGASENLDRPKVIIRVDDVQDFAFREAQLFLLNQSLENKVPLSLAIIPEVFGMDHELVETTIKAIESDCEVDVHGWEHENLTQFGFDEQKLRLLKAKQYLDWTLNAETKVLVPPMFSYDNDTIEAMEETGYTIVSGLAEFHEEGWVSEKVLSIPATIELSDYSNGTWKMKSRNVILDEVEDSINAHGYAMIVTHPQEFMKGTSLDQKIAVEFEQILQGLNENFSFTTIGDFSVHLQQNLKH
jgi:hypothetical protein